MLEDNATLSFEQVLNVMRRRWWVVLLCTAIAGFASIAVSLTQQRLYAASASLLFRDPGFDQMLFGTSLLPSNTDPTIQSGTNVDLASLPLVATLTSGALNGELSPSQVRAEVAVTPAGQSDIVNIQVTDPSPSRAALIANTYARQFISFRQQADRAKIAGAQRDVKQQLAALSPAEQARGVGQALVNRANELGTLAALQTGGAELAQAASAGSRSSKTERNGILGVLLGLILGVALVFLVERLDRRLREPSALEHAYGVPVLGVIPEAAAYAAPLSQPLPARQAEAFALLRARLRYFNVDREVRSILVTSAAPEEGKTTVALNLALAEAAAANSSVVLVEADLRRPTMAKNVGVFAGPGLAELLSRNVRLDDALQQIALPGHSNGSASRAALSIITAGAIPPNPAELLESRAMTELITTLTEHFAHVIIDSPPMSVVSDAIPLVQRVSGVVVVSRVGRSTRDGARHLSQQLKNLTAPTLGVVANAVSAKGRGYYDYEYGYTPSNEPGDAEPHLQHSGQSDDPIQTPRHEPALIAREPNQSV